jgi:hypothetical protein
VSKLPDNIQVGDRVKVFLNSGYWKSSGWFEGSVVRIDEYTEHRSFYWVEFDLPIQAAQGGSSQVVSVLNPKRIEKLPDGSDSPTT